jgi:hypothetical protein
VNQDVRQKAGKTAVDGFAVAERIYRHAYQTLMALKDALKTEFDLKGESALCSNPQSATDPRSWIYHFRGLYLAKTRISLEGYETKQIPVLFLQASLYNRNGQEPLLRYGIVEKIFNMSPLKGAKFDDYFRATLAQIHAEPSSGNIRASNCEATVRFDEEPLLDIRQDQDVEALAGEIGDNYAKLLLS